MAQSQRIMKMNNENMNAPAYKDGNGECKDS